MQTNEMLALGKQKTRRDDLSGLFVLATSYSRTAYRRTTIGAAAFHCRVRNGNGWDHCASVTRILRRISRRKILVNCKIQIADCRLIVRNIDFEISKSFCKSSI